MLMHMGIQSVVIVRGSSVHKKKHIAPMGFMVYIFNLRMNKRRG